MKQKKTQAINCRAEGVVGERLPHGMFDAKSKCDALSFTTLSYGNGVRIDVEEKLSCIMGADHNNMRGTHFYCTAPGNVLVEIAKPPKR